QIISSRQCVATTVYLLKKDKWHKTQAGAHHKHKGTQPGSKKKALKSYERHCLQKESGILTSTLATIEQLRKDTHTKAEKIACLETARQYQCDHPKYQEPSIC
ncbi:hypothetical protein Moror_15844, partial [Moniliophthora roreri MCA 2997]